jgi:hypothetical protein
MIVEMPAAFEPTLVETVIEQAEVRDWLLLRRLQQTNGNKLFFARRKFCKIHRPRSPCPSPQRMSQEGPGSACEIEHIVDCS